MFLRVPPAWLLASLSLALPALAAEHGHAGQHAHQHGLMKLDVALEGQSLTVDLESPLDSLLGFERAPRTAAERQAATTVLNQLRQGQLLKPDAAAQCQLAEATVEAPVLTQPAGAAAGEHADLDAHYRFTCQQPAQLRQLELGLFDAFARLQRVEVQWAGPQGQSRQVLQRPNRRLLLKR